MFLINQHNQSERYKAKSSLLSSKCVRHPDPSLKKMLLPAFQHPTTNTQFKLEQANLNEIFAMMGKPEQPKLSRLQWIQQRINEKVPSKLFEVLRPSY